MPLTEESGLFGTGTFDNAQFDTQVFQPPETSTTSTTPTPAVQPGTSTVVTTETILTETTENPALSPGSVTVQATETQLTYSNPTPIELKEAFIIFADETTATSTSPEPAVTPADVTITGTETVLTQTVQDPDLNSIITLAVTTSLNQTTVGPDVIPADVTIQGTETTATSTTVNPGVLPGETLVRQTNPNVLTKTVEEPTLIPGDVTLTGDLTSLTLTTEDHAILRELVTRGRTKALITTPDKYVVMEQHTFKEGDLADTLEVTLEDDNGALDLSNRDVKINVLDRDGNLEMDRKNCTVTDAANGKIAYKWEAGDVIDTPGIYKAEFVIVDNAGDDETVPNDGFKTLTIDEGGN